MKRAFMSVLMIVALVSSLVSPACAFVSGEMSFIEICAADGSVQTIALPGEQSPTGQSQHKVQKDCGFCFATTHSKPILSEELRLSTPSLSNYHRTGSGTFVPARLRTTIYQSRAPPALV